MKEKLTITQIGECVIKEMENLQYSPLTINTFRGSVNHLSKFVIKKTGADFFSEALGEEYLRESIGFPFEKPRELTSVEAKRVRCVRRIGEYQLYGAVLRNRIKTAKKTDGWKMNDGKIIEAYINAVQTADNSEATKDLRIRHIRQFYEFLATQKISGLNEISAQTISAYVASLQGDSPIYIKHRLATLRFYFRFLHQKEILQCDWSFAVPQVTAPRNLNVPALWEEHELKQLLKSIDRGSPSGKRDYAVILLVIQLGLRISDVSNLHLDNFKWERHELEWVQHKTGNRVVLPLTNDIGWAVIDYIRYGRPKVESPFVFLTSNAPYTQIKKGSIGCILDRCRMRAGIYKKIGTTGGMHSLRHALARRLLEQGTPLSTVANIMGHTSYESTSPYLKVDIEGLRDCALSVKEVCDNA